MADGYLEKHSEEYEARKAAWLRRKRQPSGSGHYRRLPAIAKRNIERPDDEAL